MKRILISAAGAALAAGLALVPAAAASAAPTDAPHTATSGQAAATAGTQEARPSGVARNGNGSHWVWGVIDGRTFSNYFHEGKCHGSTARGKGEKRVTGIAAGKWSYASVPQALSGNTAFYHTC